MKRIAIFLALLLAATSAFAGDRYFQATSSALWSFDNGGGGATSNWSSTTPGFTAAAKPVTGDVVTISAACTCDSDESAAVLTGLTITSTKTLTIASGGKIYNQNAYVTSVANGLVIAAGGTLRVIRTTGFMQVIAAGLNSITGAGTIEISSDSATNCYVGILASGSVVGTSLAAPLVIDGLNSVPYGLFFEAGGPCVAQYVRVTRCATGFTGSAGAGSTISDSIFHNCTTGVSITNLMGCDLTNCWIYNCTTGLAASWNLTNTHLTSIIFGQTEATPPVQSTNTTDITTMGPLHLVNPVFGGTGTEVNQNTSPYPHVVATAYDADKAAFKVWTGRGHTLETETTTRHTASGAAIKAITSANGAATRLGQLRWMLMAYPATHGDTLDVTVWVRCTAATSIIKVIVDPDSIFGTAQTGTYTIDGSANHLVNTYYQLTVPQYTVATTAGKKSAIPIVVQIEEASKTWYVDDFAISLNAGGAEAITLDYAPYDGVFSREAAAGGGGGIPSHLHGGHVQ